ncbi:MAG: hypothetical protein RL398_1681 [Planctomycetota bacterium]|jgi:hypothetical protein
MTSDRPTPRTAILTPVVLLAAAATAAWTALESRALRAEAKTTQAALTTAQARLDDLYGELTRLRLEQSAEQKGPAGLLAKLKAYAPMLVSARTTAPDYAAAEKEMMAILRAFETIGADAWPFVRGRIDQLKPEQNYDELKWLLEVAVRIDPKAGAELLQNILQGTYLPNARLRWHAANVLLRHDKPLAQRLLRQILETESSRGPNLERAAAYNLPIPDQAAVSQSGFFNFVIHYIRSEDPKVEETLLMMMARNEHDTLTLQECIEELGKRKCERAVDAIEKAYKNPPGRIDNPLFLVKCLDALDQIRGKAAVPFFEEAQRNATNEKVSRHVGELLAKHR